MLLLTIFPIHHRKIFCVQQSMEWKQRLDFKRCVLMNKITRILNTGRVVMRIKEYWNITKMGNQWVLHLIC